MPLLPMTQGTADLLEDMKPSGKRHQAYETKNYMICQVSVHLPNIKTASEPLPIGLHNAKMMMVAKMTMTDANGEESGRDAHLVERVAMGWWRGMEERTL